MTEPSGSHTARARRLALEAEMSPGYRPPRAGGKERVDVPPEPERPSDPGTWRVRVSWLQSIVGPIIGAAAAAGVIYGATLTRIEQLEARDASIASQLQQVATESQARHDAVAVRVYAVERDNAVRESEARAVTRSVDALADEIREMRALLTRRSR